MDKVELDVLRDLKEVKIAFINYLVGGNQKLDYVQNSHGRFTYSDILKSDFDVKQLDDIQVEVYFVSENGYYRRDTTNRRIFYDLGAELKKWVMIISKGV